MCFSPQRRAIFQHLNFKKCSETVSFLTFWLGHVLLATAACNFSTSQRPKVLRECCVLYIFTSKCASRHSGVQFFNSWTSKSGPKLTCFVHFHFKMCFSPQRRAIFQQLNFKKRSEADVFCTFSFQNVLLATAACNFSTSQLQKVLRSWHVLYIFTWKCASRHSGVQFLISPLTTWLRTRRFNEPTFRLTRHTNHWKNTAFRDVPNIWRGCLFFLLTFALLHLLSSDSTSSSDFTFFWLYFISLLFICFSTLHSVGSLLFKLPSTIVLQSTTPVLLCTTKYNSSTTLYYKVQLQYYSVLQSTTPALRTTKYYSVLQSTTPVLLCTTKYYSSTFLYYKVLLQHYSVLQSNTPVLFCTTKCCSSTTPVLWCYESWVVPAGVPSALADIGGGVAANNWFCQRKGGGCFVW